MGKLNSWRSNFRYNRSAMRAWDLTLAALRIYGRYEKERQAVALFVRDMPRGLTVEASVSLLRRTADFMEKSSTVAKELDR